MDIAQGNVGTEGHYSLDIVGKNLVAKFDYKGAQMKSSHSAELDLIAVLEIIKTKIPGSIDDAVISVIEAAINAAGK